MTDSRIFKIRFVDFSWPKNSSINGVLSTKRVWEGFLYIVPRIGKYTVYYRNNSLGLSQRAVEVFRSLAWRHSIANVLPHIISLDRLRIDIKKWISSLSDNFQSHVPFWVNWKSDAKNALLTTPDWPMAVVTREATSRSRIKNNVKIMSVM